MLGALQRDDLGQALEPVLGGDVGGLVRRGAQAVDRADVHDPAPALLVHVRQGAADQPERRLQHQPQDVGEPVDRELVDRRHVLEAGVVDQDVDGEVERVDRVEVGQVDGHGGAADLRRRPAPPRRRRGRRRRRAAPAAASRTAQARPMPEAPPVISARRPDREEGAAMPARLGAGPGRPLRSCRRTPRAGRGGAYGRAGLHRRGRRWVAEPRLTNSGGPRTTTQRRRCPCACTTPTGGTCWRARSA